jgi:hypothetical protein
MNSKTTDALWLSSTLDFQAKRSRANAHATASAMHQRCFSSLDRCTQNFFCRKESLIEQRVGNLAMNAVEKAVDPVSVHEKDQNSFFAHSGNCGIFILRTSDEFPCFLNKSMHFLLCSLGGAEINLDLCSHSCFSIFSCVVAQEQKTRAEGKVEHKI